MPQVCRVGDMGQGVCYQHKSPTPFVAHFVTGDNTVTANGQPVATVGSIGVTSCGHAIMATTGSGVTLASGKQVHRVGDTGIVLGGGYYTAITGSPDVLAGGGGPPPTAFVSPGVYSIAGLLVYDSKTPEGRAAALAEDTARLPAGVLQDAPVDAAAPDQSYQSCAQLPTEISLATMPQKISDNFILGTCKNVPVAQRGLTANKIACNWMALCQTILEPIRANFKFAFNSGFRTVDSGMGNTDHGLGCAADISCATEAETTAMFKWIVASGLPFSQVIYEKHNSAWVHISYRGKQQSADTRIMWTFTGAAPYGHGGLAGVNLPSTLKG